MRAVWTELVDKHPGLDEELYEHSEPTPAMLTSLVAEWRAAKGGVEDVAGFARQFAHQKLVLEVRPVRLRKAWTGRANCPRALIQIRVSE